MRIRQHRCVLGCGECKNCVAGRGGIVAARHHYVTTRLLALHQLMVQLQQPLVLVHHLPQLALLLLELAL